LALLTENNLRAFEVYWAALRSGLYITAVNNRLKPDEVAYIKAFMIISGGVNIYPQEIENVLALHPAVYDVAVIGLPDPEMGESVGAFIQPAAGAVPGPELEQEIIAYVKSKIASFKAPGTIRFVDELPRSETGKLMKSQLKAMYAHR
jgi:long-chain acyl-CoA synthetase